MQTDSNIEENKEFISPRSANTTPPSSQQLSALPAKRNLRSASSTSSTGGESTITTATSVSSTSSSVIDPFSSNVLLVNTLKYVKSIQHEDIISTSTPQQSQDQGNKLGLEKEDIKSRYDLRKRISPLRSSLERISPVRETCANVTTAKNVIKHEEIKTSSSQNQQHCSFSNIFKKMYTSGYLRFNLKQLFTIIIASILLLLTLSIINRFNIVDIKNANIDTLYSTYAHIKSILYTNVCVNAKKYVNDATVYGRHMINKVFGSY